MSSTTSGTVARLSLGVISHSLFSSHDQLLNILSYSLGALNCLLGALNCLLGAVCNVIGAFGRVLASFNSCSFSGDFNSLLLVLGSIFYCFSSAFVGFTNSLHGIGSACRVLKNLLGAPSGILGCLSTLSSCRATSSPACSTWRRGIGAGVVWGRWTLHVLKDFAGTNEFADRISCCMRQRALAHRLTVLVQPPSRISSVCQIANTPTSRFTGHISIVVRVLQQRRRREPSMPVSVRPDKHDTHQHLRAFCDSA
ncbi:hypothetical protein FA95DRAFT_446122 [Auriscalpium vulgare]|uniref:Uncharacterized protein n=1 Tax=Auriscalpium vulgare TaxID=40419 RepID=A0ACB8RH47_9AGAM|nr:hypothetical protein FA95DRAFT_446122 [Auriscalpium vulgare]